MKRLLLLSMLVLSGLAASSQVNDQGTIHLAVGEWRACHQYEQTSHPGRPHHLEGVGRGRHRDLPIGFQYGLAKVFSQVSISSPAVTWTPAPPAPMGWCSSASPPVLPGEQRAFRLDGAPVRWQHATDRMIRMPREPIPPPSAVPTSGSRKAWCFQFKRPDAGPSACVPASSPPAWPLKELERNGGGQSLENFEADLNTGGFTLGASFSSGSRAYRSRYRLEAGPGQGSAAFHR